MKSLLENLVSEQKQVITQEEQRLDVLDGELQQLRDEVGLLAASSAKDIYNSGIETLKLETALTAFQKATQQDLHNAHEYTKCVSIDLEKLAAGELGVTRDLLKFVEVQVETNRLSYVHHAIHWVAWGGLVAAFVLHCLGAF